MGWNRVTRAALALSAGCVAIGVGFVTPQAQATPGTSETWSSPGNSSWVVPAGVTAITVDVMGAQGGGSTGGLGGWMTADFTVTPGETIEINVGGRGTSSGGGANGGGGLGGTALGYGGGGASDIRRGGTTLAHRVLVAGGGGGSAFGAGGAGGGASPTAGPSDSGIPGGQPGTASAGGAGGTGLNSGGTGSLGVGGQAGGDGFWTSGGGGGGYYGGGGGAAQWPGMPGGGGGSAYADLSANLTLAMDGVQSGDGEVTISWVAPATTTTSAPTTTTTVPTSDPAPTMNCPSPLPAMRVSTNAFGLAVARFLIDHCGSTGREVSAGGELFWVVDPPKGSTCPSWQVVQVPQTRAGLLIAKHLLDNCRYEVRGQSGVIYVVPKDHPAGRIG